MSTKTDAKVYNYVEFVSLLKECGVLPGMMTTVISTLIVKDIIRQTPDN